MTLRNVPKAHTLEQQRQEINLIASDLDTAVDGTKTFGGNKEFTGDVTFSSTVEFSDSVVANFGDDADLKIYYDGSVGVQTSFIDSDALQIRSATDTSELYATFLKDGPVELYYDGTKRFGTSATGASAIGTFDVSGATEFSGATNLISGSNKLNFNTNTNQEGQLWANSDYFYINSSATFGMNIQSNSIAIRSASGGENYFTASINNGALLYHDDVKKFETTATGVSITGNIDSVTDISCNSIINNAGGTPTFSIFNTGNALFEDVEATSLHMKDDKPAYFGTNEDASLYYDNTSSDLRLDSEVGFHVRWYDSVNTQYEDQVVFSPFGSTNFYYQGAANPTLSIDDGIDIDGVVTVGSSSATGEVRLAVGGSQANYLKVFASSGETYIRNRDNDIGATATTINIQGRTGVALWQDTGNLGLQVDSSCAVKLYYQTSEKLKTTTDGVEITGTLDVSDTLDVTGNTTIGAPDVTNASTGGVQAFSSGQLRIQRDGSGSATDKRFQMYYGTSETASITAGGDATFAGDITLTDDTKQINAQKIKPITTGTGTSLTIGGAGLANIVMESDVVIFDQIGFMAFGSSAGLNLGPYGTGALNVTNGTGVNGIFRRYEEGTWDPDFLGLSAAFTGYSNKVGKYTRIGDVVHVHGFIQLNAQPSFTTATDYLRLGPLPFNHDSSKNAGYNVTVGGVSCQNFNFHDNDYSNTGQVACGINTDATSGDSYVIFQVSGNNNTRGIVKNSAIGTDDVIEFQLSYQA